MSALQRLVDELEGAAMEYAHECASDDEHDILQSARKAVVDKITKLEQQLEAAQKDTTRLLFATSEIDGFILIEKDKYNFAIECAIVNGRDVPAPEDELNGIRRLIDAAIAASKEEVKL